MKLLVWTISVLYGICCLEIIKGGKNIMINDLKKIGAKAYLNDDDMIIQNVTYIYEDRTESEPLSKFIHLGMTADSILFGDEGDIRFIVYPNPLLMYDTDVDSLEFINDSSCSVTISCFGQQLTLVPPKKLKGSSIMK